ncbi:hypothetical protein RAB80_003089 [Fusarium oxysporum f. sp. vasinfectum]|nr:hypothetical protein RAB80_003089 [Fusarium oxysporum f. sp. vasinfectum]KAK2934271.1 hypothetical protein FoTM2_005517 [Fusarium oxysporum f. sp. vasinfectum]
MLTSKGDRCSKLPAKQWTGLARLLLEFFSAGFLGATMLGWSPSSSHKPGTQQQPSTMTYDLTATRILVVDFGAARK